MAGERRNILFIMCDQLRFDYLGCTGHPHLETPHIDWLASRSVRFDRAYVQSPICGPSRMSFYTGRYVRSHGSTWNGIPLRVGEMTLGDHLRRLGVRTALCGKTHMAADAEGLERLGIDPSSTIGVLQSECGFEPWDRLDGLHPAGYGEPSHYNDYLSGLQYGGPNPWEQWANSGEADDGEVLSGWLLEHADKPARIAEEHSETPYSTTRAMEFIDAAGDQPWCLHLSYIKPHWPYIVPAPYHDMYGAKHVIPVKRSDDERHNAHPLLKAYYQHRFSEVFNRDGVREHVIPAYMGLIKQIDDQLGRLWQFLEKRGLFDNTMIVFTSDHGDYLGDHWLGEKELFHEQSVRIPLIVYDPSAAAAPTRGSVSEALVEAIDLVPTFIEFIGGEVRSNILEGHSLLPLLHEPGCARPRQIVISEYDYAVRRARRILDVPVPDCKLIMAFDGRWKYVHIEGMDPMLYDLESDPDEFADLGRDPAFEADRQRLREEIFAWSRKPACRITATDDQIRARSGGEFKRGIKIGFWDQADIDEAEREGESGN
ncbi:MAG: sulfatase-like hydrolase/transferase [Hyphomicrobiaceae bacterium]